MSNFYSSAAARVRALLPTARPALEPFTDLDWRAQAAYREAGDVLAYATRYAVTVVPTDGKARHFILRGSFPRVHRRARALFPANETAVLVIEPAQAQHGGESIDARLNNTYHY